MWPRAVGRCLPYWLLRRPCWRGACSGPNQSLQPTGAAALVPRGIESLRPPRRLSWVFGGGGGGRGVRGLAIPESAHARLVGRADGRRSRPASGRGGLGRASVLRGVAVL